MMASQPAVCPISEAKQGLSLDSAWDGVATGARFCCLLIGRGQMQQKSLCCTGRSRCLVTLISFSIFFLK